MTLRRIHALHYFRNVRRASPELRLETMLSIVKEKLGEAGEVRAWNLRPADTCMKANREGLTLSTKACESVCYACRRNERTARVDERAAINLRIASRPDFSELMIGAIFASGVEAFRIHSYGDFFSESYFSAWNRVVATCCSVEFWCYTRAWRLPSLVPCFTSLATMAIHRFVVSGRRAETARAKARGSLSRGTYETRY